MFVKKLVEKASRKPVGNSEGLKPGDVEPRLAFHYGIPSGAILLAYDPPQELLAISTKDGRIKLFGKDNTQALLQSPEALPSKFLQFFQNKGILVNITSSNHIEVWDVDKKLLSHVHVCKEDITSFMVMQHAPFMYVGDSIGNVSVFKLDEEICRIAQMQYNIPFHASHGTPNEVSSGIAVLHILPQPTAESKRILLVFRDGLIALWDIRESKSILTIGGSLLQSYHEAKGATCACWACPLGSKAAVGYSNGEIFIWKIPATTDIRTATTADSSTYSIPISKLNLGYKLEKIPIASLKWLHADGKASRLYVMGASDFASTNLLQVILLNEHTETRTIKLGLHLSEPCIDMEIISSTSENNKHKQDSFILLGKSGQIYAYDDYLIERYLLQSQSRGSLSLPKEVKLKMPFADSNITVAKFITNDSFPLSFSEEDYILLVKNFPSLFPCEEKPKDGTLGQFSGFTNIKNLYISGHSNGAINFWDASCQLLIPVLSLKQQSEDDFTLSGVALTALYFDGNSRILISGDQNGTVRIFKFKPEPYASENNFLPFQGSSKKGNNHIIQSIKLIKVNGCVLSMNRSHSSGRLAIGTDQGYVSVLDLEGPTLLYQKHIASEISAGIVSAQFTTCSLRGFEKNVLVVATKDSSILALQDDNGNMLSTTTIHPKKPSKALFMQVLDGQHLLTRGSNMPNSADVSRVDSIDYGKESFVLLCSEKAVYVYALNSVGQGVKKVHSKKKFHSSSCCWASSFYRGSDVGLILLLSTGKIEIRCLPDLSLLSELSLRGFTHSAPKLNSMSDCSVCCSWDGELIVLNGYQEMYVVSTLLKKENFRLLNSVSQVYQKDLILSQEGLAPGSMVPKDKKKGIFSSVIRDIKGTKPKQVPEIETEDTRESIEELSTILSATNFEIDVQHKDSLAMDDDGIELDVDDIDLEDPGEKPKEHQNMLAALNKPKLAKKFQAFGGKIMQMKGKNEKNVNKEEEQNDKVGAVDQIKKKYGFSLAGDSSGAKIAESKLHENLTKLQGINLKATEMQDTASSFSSLAKEMLRIAEKDKRAS